MHFTLSHAQLYSCSLLTTEQVRHMLSTTLCINIQFACCDENPNEDLFGLICIGVFLTYMSYNKGLLHFACYASAWKWIVFVSCNGIHTFCF